MRTPISFFVPGIPKPAGSKRGFYIKKIKRVIITDDCKGSRDWKTDVKHAGQANYDGPLWDGPIILTLRFNVMRPKCHLRSNGLVKDTAPKRPTTRPDALKLARAVEDALSGVIWVDDSQIVDENLHKDYSERPGCYIEIKEAE
jgi:Holliday junction resolvase RusA-like endonuclease